MITVMRRVRCTGLASATHLRKQGMDVSRLVDRTGNVYGRLTVICRAPNNTYGVCWLCRCECGTELAVYGGSLASGNTTSCGCYKAELLPAKRPSAESMRGNLYGVTHGWTGTPEHIAWSSMKWRCKNKRNPKYGGRGISVCQEWQDSFEAFLAYVGERPGPEYSLDRIDSDGNYEPGNVRWATLSEQNLNRKRRS